MLVCRLGEGNTTTSLIVSLQGLSGLNAHGSTSSDACGIALIDRVFLSTTWDGLRCTQNYRTVKLMVSPGQPPASVEK